MVECDTIIPINYNIAITITSFIVQNDTEVSSEPAIYVYFILCNKLCIDYSLKRTFDIRVLVRLINLVEDVCCWPIA